MIKTIAYGIGAAVIFVSPVLAQTKPPAPKPPTPPAVQTTPQNGDVPQQTTASYGDWILQCVQPAGEAETCEVLQVAQLQGRPFSRVGLAKPEKGQPAKLVVQVPVNVSFGTAVRIQTSEQDAGLSASFATCTPNGCFAMFDLKEDELKKLRAAGTGGTLSFADSGGHPVKIPLSFTGFNQAFEALNKK